jgi:hypothetical protein
MGRIVSVRVTEEADLTRLSRMVREDKVRSRKKLCNGYRRWSCVGKYSIHEFTDEDDSLILSRRGKTRLINQS